MNKEMSYIYIMEYYPTIRKDKIVPFETAWMELEGIMLGIISQTEKDKYHMILAINGILKK